MKGFFEGTPSGSLACVALSVQAGVRGIRPGGEPEVGRKAGRR
jgi:hypothetical protein